MATLSTLVINVKGNSAHLQKELSKASKKAKAFAKKVRANSEKVVKSLGTIGTVGAVALGAIYKQSSANIDALAKQADKLGMTTRALGGLQHAADLTGVSSKALNKGLLDMTVKVQDAAKGTGEAKEAIKELGLNAQVLAKMSPDQQFKKIAEAMKGVEHHGNKVAIAYDLFGAKGTDLINTLALGEAGLNKTAKEADALGISLNRVDASKVEAANDSLTKSAGVFTGIGNSITIGLSPYVNALSDEFYNSALEVGGFGEFTTKALNAVVESVAYSANVIHGLKAVWLVVKLAAAAAITGILEGLELLDSGLTSFLNSLPGVEAKASGFISGMADAMRTQMNTIQDDLTAFAMKPLPHDGIVAWAEEAKRKSLEAAEVVAAAAAESGGYTKEQAGIGQETGDATDTDDEKDVQNKKLNNKQSDEQKKVKSHEEKILEIKSKNSKKFAAIQEAIRIKNMIKEKASQMKIAIGEGYVAIQKAWSSAPFPFNIPAVAMATGSTAMNIAGIAGLENGGNVGSRSIVEVGERNKPELLEFGGKNFLLGGNGGAVFNQSQMQSVSGGGGGGGIVIEMSNVFEGDVSEDKMSDFIAQNYEAVYSAVANAKAERGEEF
tara:strand:+ start:26217 stop:28046 length:1830 start_codon:yes stop_codon:yes gene_type:complete